MLKKHFLLLSTKQNRKAKTKIFHNIMHVFTATFDQFNAENVVLNKVDVCQQPAFILFKRKQNTKKHTG